MCVLAHPLWKVEDGQGDWLLGGDTGGGSFAGYGSFKVSLNGNMMILLWLREKDLLLAFLFVPVLSFFHPSFSAADVTPSFIKLTTRPPHISTVLRKPNLHRSSLRRFAFISNKLRWRQVLKHFCGTVSRGGQSFSVKQVCSALLLVKVANQTHNSRCLIQRRPAEPGKFGRKQTGFLLPGWNGETSYREGGSGAVGAKTEGLVFFGPTDLQTLLLPQNHADEKFKHRLMIRHSSTRSVCRLWYFKKKVSVGTVGESAINRKQSRRQPQRERSRTKPEVSSQSANSCLVDLCAVQSSSRRRRLVPHRAPQR